jgi:hypothetical protein
MNYDYRCPECNRILEPTYLNPRYLMCYSCIKGYTIEELER